MIMLASLTGAALATDPPCYESNHIDWLAPTDGQTAVPTDVRLLGSWGGDCIGYSYDVYLTDSDGDEVLLSEGLGPASHGLIELPTILRPETEYHVEVRPHSDEVAEYGYTVTFATGTGPAEPIGTAPTAVATSSRVDHYVGHPDFADYSTYEVTLTVDVQAPTPTNLAVLKVNDPEWGGLVAWVSEPVDTQTVAVWGNIFGDLPCLDIFVDDAAGVASDVTELCFEPDVVETHTHTSGGMGCQTLTGTPTRLVVAWALVAIVARRRTRSARGQPNGGVSARPRRSRTQA